MRGWNISRKCPEKVYKYHQSLYIWKVVSLSFLLFFHKYSCAKDHSCFSLIKYLETAISCTLLFKSTAVSLPGQNKIQIIIFDRVVDFFQLHAKDWLPSTFLPHFLLLTVVAAIGMSILLVFCVSYSTEIRPGRPRQVDAAPLSWLSPCVTMNRAVLVPLIAGELWPQYVSILHGCLSITAELVKALQQ